MLKLNINYLRCDPAVFLTEKNDKSQCDPTVFLFFYPLLDNK